ncbi:hypothetical protein EK21DRAFT_87516 [Setomelanomma holmii]|uniref:Uncharacterized protein n=1 Tax=Setomelanomma holmii TaxID=210430 RepID=A0A9P4HCJ6_9PLEO|nr:hypothetical protein EK21DRAFT_87516 [Setomelanomma holmii]
MPSMAQCPSHLTPGVNREWLALHQKHEQEIGKFKEEVAKARVDLEKRAEAARQRLLAKHMNEENEFWRNNGRATTTTNPTASDSRTTPTQLRGAAAPTASAPTSRPNTARPQPGSRPSNPPPKATRPNASHTANPARPEPSQKKSVPEVIDLCDLDEDVQQPRVEKSIPPKTSAQPAVAQQQIEQDAVTEETIDGYCMQQTQTGSVFSIPSASLKLFGSSPKVFTGSFSSPFQSRSASTSKLFRQGAQEGFNMPAPSSSFVQQAASTVPLSTRSAFSPQVAPRSFTPAPLPIDERPELPFGSLRQQLHDRSAILKDPRPLPRNETLFALEQQKRSGAFVDHALRNARSYSIAPEQSYAPSNRDGRMNGDADMRERWSSARDISMLDAEAGRRDALRHTFTSQSREASAVPYAQVQREAFPTPSPSHVSLASEPITPPQQDLASAPAAFKKPSVPASAVYLARSIAPEARRARAGTVDSRASSFTLPAAPRNQRGAPAASRFSETSEGTRSRKRAREFNLSSDEDESDYAPSEPGSP